MSKLLRVLAGMAVVGPILAFLLGVILLHSIPGCSIEPGSGCLVHGTDWSHAVALLQQGGFYALLLGIPAALVLLILAAAASYLERPRRPIK